MEPEEAIGVAVPVQDVVESRVAAIAVSVVKAMEPAEAIGTFVPESSMAEATVVASLITSFHRVEEDAVE